ncbi:protein neprosin isoform X2 [Quercus suber]|uniref:protein neprosin isoform X2 n=1 Tax=Quercus suber TaxID=58331 RepID=UPI0032DED72B
MAPPCGSERRWSRAVKMTFYLFFLIPMSSAGNGKTNTIFGKKQKLEIQQQLKRLNKPALKSIEGPDGDIIDCVDIYKQPAFDHPLLKNHTIQPWHLNGRCPEGTIPIRRTKEEDLLRAGSVANFGRKKYHTIPDAQNKIEVNPHEYAMIGEAGDKYYGMSVEMNLWNPHTQEDNEFSISQFLLTNGVYVQDLNAIEGGAMVYKDLYGDKETRIFISWTDDEYQQTGCFNLACPGFVQVNKQIAMGARVTPYSKYDGNQFALKFHVWKDINARGDWWLSINQRDFGYWPSSLFSILSDSASTVKWGGEVLNYYKDGQHTTTQMGSGHFAEEGAGKASFFKNLNVIDGLQIQRAPRDTMTLMSKPNCYNIIDYGDYFYFGGPGRNPNCP